MATDKPQPATADIDLIVATVGREKELSLFLASVRDQAPVRARVIIADQNHDDRIVFVLGARAWVARGGEAQCEWRCLSGTLEWPDARNGSDRGLA